MLIKYYADIPFEDFDRLFHWMFHCRRKLKPVGRFMMFGYSIRKSLPMLSEDDLDDLYSEAYLRLRQVTTRTAERCRKSTIIINCIKWTMFRMMQKKKQERTYRKNYSRTYVGAAGDKIQHTLNPTAFSRVGRAHLPILQHNLGLVDGITRTLQNTGDHFGISKERVRQLNIKALDKIDPELIVEDEFVETYSLEVE